MRGNGERSAEGRDCRVGSVSYRGPAHLAKLGIVNEVWPVTVDESTEGQAILPAGGEVGYIDMGVAAVRETLRLRNEFF